MGCFFGCFRARDDSNRRPHLVSGSIQSKPAEAVVPKNRLSALFLSEGEDFVYSNRKTPCSGSPEINKELVNEAKFLKACGTLPETPSEIRKASEKLKGSPPCDKDLEFSDFHSWLPNTSIKKFPLDKQIDQPPTPIKLCEELGHGSPSSEQTPSRIVLQFLEIVCGIPIHCFLSDDFKEESKDSAKGCISNVQNTGRKSISSADDATNIPFKNKSVRFDCNFDTSSSKGSSSENVLNILRKADSSGDLSISKASPKPTPVKLSDEMQTPGTVFPASLEVLANGKTRIRSQYVHPVLNPIENVTQWKELQEDGSKAHQLSSQLKASLDKPENSTPKSGVGATDASLQELKVEGSLSSWFKPKQSDQDGDPTDGTASGKNFRYGRTPIDRPIIGLVATHWNENESSNISPKWWDGNGIPNSTNKYKEDQKVSWHATPFEERLEKALSEESFISQKTHMSGRPVVFDERDENDTALSKLQAPTHSKSVVSC